MQKSLTVDYQFSLILDPLSTIERVIRIISFIDQGIKLMIITFPSTVEPLSVRGQHWDCLKCPVLIFRVIVLSCEML